MIKNFRDLCEIAWEADVPLRRGCLIRSANLHQATPEDLAGITAVIDLRTGVEAEQAPDRIAEWVTYHHVPLFDEAAVGITRERTFSEIPNMTRLYRVMVEDERLRPNLQKVLEIISSHDYAKGAILWHCTAGKDRGGLVAAMVLRVLGVGREHVMQDYLRSNDTCLEEGEAAYRSMLAEGQTEEFALGVRDAFLAKPEYLQAAFDAHDRHPMEFPEAERFRRAVLLG